MPCGALPIPTQQLYYVSMARPRIYDGNPRARGAAAEAARRDRMREAGLVHVLVRIPTVLRAKARKAAAEAGVTLAEVVAAALARKLKPE